MLRWATNCPTTAFEELGPEAAETAPQIAPAAHTEASRVSRARHDPEDHAARQNASEAVPDHELGIAACQYPQCGSLLTLDQIKGCRKHFGEERWCTVHGKLKKQEEAAAGVADPFVEA